MKKLYFKDRLRGIDICINVNEVLNSEYGLYLWPSAPVLAQYIFYHRENIDGKRILELGAGTALAGCMAAKVGGKVTLSDSNDLPDCLERCRETCLLNDLKEVCVVGLTWGEFSPTLLELEPVDVILGSDCFYDTKDFESILVTVSYLMDKQENVEFWTTYQERSSRRTLEQWMTKWGLVGKEVKLADFEADSSDIAESGLPGNHSIKMFIVRKETVHVAIHEKTT